MDDVPVLDATDREAVSEASKPDLRLWLRLLTCTTMVENEVRARLRQDFNVTLPRFDLMAALDKAPDGLTMGALSRQLMVSNGNVTGVTERLVAEGLVSRLPAPTDRRTQYVKLTDAGRQAFRVMAEAHERWVTGMFEGLDRDEMTALAGLLGKAKRSVRASIDRKKTS